MKKLIKLKYLKKYLSRYLWRLQDSSRLNYDYPDYTFFVFKAELDKSLSEMEKVMTTESDRTEVKDALKYILNDRDFDYRKLLLKSAGFILSTQEKARDIFLYMWKFMFDEQWEYQPGVEIHDFIVIKDRSPKQDIAKIIMQKKWHDNRDYITWDTQIFFSRDGTGTLSYIHLKNANKILLNFRYKIREYNYSNTTCIMIHFPVLNVAFELVVKVMKAMTQMYSKRNGNSNILLKMSDNPYFLTQDYLNHKSHSPRETIFYQLK